MLKKADEKLKKYPIAYVIYGLLAVALVIRGLYGFCQSDESFYISTAGRFASGDLVFADEWHPTQLSSLISMPFYRLFTLVTGGTDGITAYFRVLYVLMTTVLAAVSYRIVSGKGAGGDGAVPENRRFPRIPALALGLFLMLYAHLNMPTLSYYTLSFNFFVAAFITVYAGLPEPEKDTDGAQPGQSSGGQSAKAARNKGTACMLTGGILFALSVLSLPTLVLAALPVMLILAAVCIRVRILRRPLLLFTAGTMIPLLIFIIYLYASGNSIAGLLANLSYIMSDSEHDRGYVESVKVFFRAISDVFGRIYYLSIVLVILALLSYVNQNVKKYIQPSILYTDLLLFIYYVVFAFRYTGFMNTAFALFVFPLFFLTKKKDWYIFISMFMGGLVFAMVCALSSFCDLYVLAVGHGIAAAGGIILLWDMFMELYEEAGNEILYERIWKKSAAAAIIVVMSTFILITGALRFVNVYRDARIELLNTRITSGPGAGMMTTVEHKAQYDSVLSSIKKYTADRAKTDRILFSKLLPWGYTAAGLTVAAPDTWRNPVDSERLMEYYESHEMPDLVFVLNTEVGSYEDSGDVEADLLVNLNEFSGKFAEILKKDYEEHIEKDCTVYVRVSK